MKKIFVAFMLGVAMFSGAVQASEQGYVEVTTSIVREVQPDMAEFSVTIETRNPDKNKAVQENTKNATAVVKALKPLVGDSGLKTERYSVTPQYRWENSKQIFETYYVNSTYTVTTQELDKVPELINLALENGATGTNGLRFSLKNRAKHYDCMYKEAVLENKRKADNVAAALGRKIGAPKTIELSPDTQEQVYPVARMMKMDAVNASGSTLAPVENGLVKINVRVESKFYIK